MMKLYLVTREGVYRHEILGVFDEQNKAEIIAKDIASKEPDTRHNITVSEADLNVQIDDVKDLSTFNLKDSITNNNT